MHINIFFDGTKKFRAERVKPSVSAELTYILINSKSLIATPRPLKVSVWRVFHKVLKTATDHMPKL